MADNRDMEITLAPLAGPRLLLPLKISVRTLFEMLDIEASGVRAGRMRVSSASGKVEAER
jgi:hypothetical protein